MSVRHIRAMDCDGDGCTEWAELPPSVRSDSFVPEGWMRVQGKFHDGSQTVPVRLCAKCMHTYLPLALAKPAQGDLLATVGETALSPAPTDGC